MNIVRVLVAVAALLVAGCAAGGKSAENVAPYELGSDYVMAGYAVADSLEANLRFPIAKNQPIIVASFVSVDNLTQTSTFGRMMAEHVASRLAQKGYSVIELKLRQNSLFIQEGKGEFMLSRDIREISRSHNAGAVVVGTYGDTREKTYVAARFVRTDDSLILSSCDYAVRKTLSPIDR